MQYLFKSGHIKDYDVILDKDNVIVLKGKQLQCARKVPGLQTFLEKAKDVRLGWGQFEHDGDEVIYIYDKADENFGYALNLDDDHCSEWGYSPL